MAEEEPQKEAENQEQNAESTEAVEAGAEAAEEVAVDEPKAPSLLMPMLLSAVITVVGVGVMFVVILPKQIKEAIAAASAASHHDGNSTDSHGDSHAAEGDSHAAEGDSHAAEGDSHESDKEEGAAAGTEDDNPKKPEPIVPEGESIVINPAGSGGTRYLLVEIFLLREDEKDKGFPKAILDHTKLLQAATVDQLSAEDAQSLADPATKERLKSTLKSAYQRLLDPESQGDYKINKLIISKWIMQ